MKLIARSIVDAAGTSQTGKVAGGFSRTRNLLIAAYVCQSSTAASSCSLPARPPHPHTLFLFFLCRAFSGL